MLALT